MRVIRAEDDDPMGKLEMLALLIDWNIRRCNVEGCKALPSTIIAGLEGAHTIGICEEHFQKANKPSGPVKYKFVWDSFNAWDYAEKERNEGSLSTDPYCIDD